MSKQLLNQRSRGRIGAAAVSAVMMLGSAGTALASTQPTNVSVASLYMSNWQDAMNIWMASKLAQTDTGTFGPRLAEMHISNDWNTNQIVDWSDFFRDETHTVKYDQPHNFNSKANWDEGGILRTTYLDYSGANMPVTVTRDFAQVPNQHFTVATLTFTNPTASPIVYNLLDQLHVNNKTRGGASSNVHGYYDGARNALFVDMSGSGQYYAVLGSLQTTLGHQVANDGNGNTSTNDVAAWYTFDANGTVKGNNDEITPDISVSFQDKFTIPANGTVTRSFYVTIQGTLSGAQSAADTARAQTASYWQSQTQSAYASWLTGPGKKTVNFADAGINAMYTRGLVTIKNSINPASGALPAATNPIGYSYKVWIRDSAVTAMVLDQAGFTAEAEKYWYWLQQRQSTDGTFKTTFNLWDSSYMSFVEPESDSIGMFLIGAYLHYKITGNTTFLNNIWPAYQKSADYLWSNIGTDPYGFGVPDYSIWEETYEYNAFSQTVFTAGEDAAQYMARAIGRWDLADNYNGVAGKIRSNLQKNDTWGPPGMWNVNNGYYNRAVNTNGTPRNTVDGASDALMVFGVVDSNSSRANSMVNKVIASNGHDNYGICRYAGDNFYYTNAYSPAGNETQSDSPDWPQLSAYLALNALYKGDPVTALNYMQWIVSRSFAGYMAQGEAVSRTLLTPAVSTGVEPVTAAWFVLTSLVYTNQADIRITPVQANAGAYKYINVTGTISNDWGQWNNVPYFKDAQNDSVSGSGDTDIASVYLANDANNLYVRIKNRSGHLSGYNTAPKFAIQLYSEDFKHSGTGSKSTGFNGGQLDRSMQYFVSRWSDSGSYGQWNVQNGNWTWINNVGGVINPQWDPNSGQVEFVVPFWTLSSTGSVATNDWAYMNIVLTRQDPSTGAWREDDYAAIHYRVTQNGDAWYYGNVE